MARAPLLRPPGAAAWLNARRIKAIGMTWPMLLLAIIVVPGTPAWEHHPGLTLFLCAAALAMHALGAHWAMGPRAKDGGALRALLVHAVATFVGALLLLSADDGIRDSYVVLAFGLMLTFTPLVGAAHALLAVIARRALRRAGHDSRERVLVRTGAWAAGLAALWPLASMRYPAAFAAPLVAWTTAAVCLPLAGVVWGLVRQRGWRKWLEAVAAGQVPGWGIVDQVPRDVSQLAPVVAGDAWAPAAKQRVLVWTQATNTPFREAEVEEPLALVETSPESHPGGSARGGR